MYKIQREASALMSGRTTYFCPNCNFVDVFFKKPPFTCPSCRHTLPNGVNLESSVEHRKVFHFGGNLGTWNDDKT